MTDLKAIDLQIQKLQQEADAVSRAGPDYSELWEQTARQLAEAEHAFKEHGLLIDFRSQLPEHEFLRRQVIVGAAIVAGRDAVIASEKARIKARTATGISAAEKQRRLPELSAALLRACARRELALRQTETEGHYQPRDQHPELLIFTQAEVERLAA